MKIKYLGTGAAEGIPALYCNCPICQKAKKLKGKEIRTRSQALINGELLIDFPADTYYHMLREDFDLSGIENLLITHSHSDHFYINDFFMREEGYAHSPTVEKLRIYGNKHVYNALNERMREESSKRLEIYRLDPFIPADIGGYRVTPLQAAHMLEQEEQPLIYVIQKDGKTLLYGNDTGYFPENTWEALKAFRFDLVSLDSTMGAGQGFTGHMNLECNSITRLRMLEEGMAGENTKFIAVHFSHNKGMNHEEIVREAEKLGFETAFDGMEAEV